MGISEQVPPPNPRPSPWKAALDKAIRELVQSGVEHEDFTELRADDHIILPYHGDNWSTLASFPPQEFHLPHNQSQASSHYKIKFKRLLKFGTHEHKVSETRIDRARRLLELLDYDIILGKPLQQERYENLRRLAKSYETSLFLKDQLFSQQNQPQVRWILIDILADHIWDELAPWLINNWPTWDIRAERAPILGAILSFRRNKIPTEFRETLRQTLSAHILGSPQSAKEGLEPLQTELLVHAISTFGSFANTADLLDLYKIATQNSTFHVGLAATESLTRIISRTAHTKETHIFMETHKGSILKHIQTFASIRHISPKNGSMLWALSKLLLARCGPESTSILPLINDHPQISNRLIKIFRESESHLIKIEQKNWLNKQSQSTEEFIRHLKGQQSSQTHT